MNTASSHDATPDEQAFLTERSHVCEDFAAHEATHQNGQLSRGEYLVVGLLLAIAYVLTLALQ
ncbi:hypothetical protein CQ013_08340 [Arthrobacter sp. MYb216]|uniref:hypothetical protein n=1 Tax=unclassified Arthrobacter TaxID=235627 RepID=UPI000D4CCC4C|nr:MULTISPECIES: hypothetical protein [unclassified Arthrobacter]PRB51775.1 hypothetical protein CQ013_08340 [Arthrobacter sp. MYb216]